MGAKVKNTCVHMVTPCGGNTEFLERLKYYVLRMRNKLLVTRGEKNGAAKSGGLL